MGARSAAHNVVGLRIIEEIRRVVAGPVGDPYRLAGDKARRECRECRDFSHKSQVASGWLARNIRAPDNT